MDSGAGFGADVLEGLEHLRRRPVAGLGIIGAGLADDRREAGAGVHRVRQGLALHPAGQGVLPVGKADRVGPGRQEGQAAVV